MKIEVLKDKLLKNKLLQGVMLGVAVTVAVEVAVLLGVKLVNGSDNIDETLPSHTEEYLEDSDQPAVTGKEISDVSDKIEEYEISLAEYDREEGSIRRGEFFSTLMSRLGVPQRDIYELEVRSDGIFDMKQIRVGNHYHAYYTRTQPRELAYLVYEKDRFSYVLFSLKDTLAVSLHEKDITTEINYVEVTINSSLWNDVIAAGAPALLALKLSDIYAWSIDFFGLQKGDSFKAVYQETKCEGEVINVENLLYAEFSHGGHLYKSYYYDDGSGNLYWNEKGESMRKAFLKAPLSYTRVSSGFTYSRRHPVTRKVRPHTGVDYAAPMGTEVMSIGDGVVVYKGYKKAEGHMVKIKHNSVYTSAYLHLSKYGKGIQTGQRVKQGDIIGYVGSTGYSTGPHLDFRIWKNGTPINPLKMESPPAEPIAEKMLSDFRKSQAESERAASAFRARQVLKEIIKKP